MIYEFQCPKCNHVTEVMTSDAKLKEVPCEKCSGQAEKIISTNNYRWRYNDK